MSTSTAIAIRLLSEPRYLRVVRPAVERAAAVFGLDAEAAAQVVLAVEEALTNVIRHGYHNRADGPIDLALRPLAGADGAGIEVVIEDESEHFAPEQVRGRPLGELRPGGLGVHIIRAAMDEVDYQCRTDRPGMRLRMARFNRPQPETSHDR
jgi:serine/threonine-protein kinase RsbW